MFFVFEIQICECSYAPENVRLLRWMQKFASLCGETLISTFADFAEKRFTDGTLGSWHAVELANFDRKSFRPGARWAPTFISGSA